MRKIVSSVAKGKMWVLIDNPDSTPRFEIKQVERTFNYQSNWRYVERSGSKRPVETVKRYLETQWEH